MPTPTKSKGKIIVSGILMWYPLAGVTYQFLHYMIGLRRLGYDPYYIEDSGRWIYDPRLNDLSPDATGNLQAIVPVLEAHGFGDRWAFRGNYPDGQCYGMTEAQILQLYREADGFLNVCGAQEVREEHMTIKRRIYVESDPVAAQIKVAQGDKETIATLDAHDAHFSFGENFYNPDCKVPLIKYQWKRTRQPVVLDLWADAAGPADTFTTIATWQNKGKDIVYNGETYYWSKDREFMKFIDLPSRRPVKFGLALGQEKEVQDLLKKYSWQWLDSLEVSKTIDSYRKFIQSSRGEFTVAKDQNIRLCSGWFSDRTACYLASGRPVITQETGFSNVLPTGKGLFGFLTMDDVLAAVDTIETDYKGACRAARDIAAEYFDAEKVVGKLMQEAGL